MSPELTSLISPPVLSIASDHYLSLESNLQKLPMYDFAIDSSCTCTEVANYLEQYPRLPGVVLLEQGKFLGMISRRRILEFFIRPFGQELFAKANLYELYSYARTEILLLPETTTILAAMQHTLKRSPELFAEPIVVQTETNTYKLLDIHDLNLAAWQIRGIETQVRYERSQAQMIQNDKMARLGRLVDGVAHEILDPVGFIWGNLTYISKYSQDLLKLIAAYAKDLPEGSAAINYLKEEIEFDFLEEDLSKALASAHTGAERLKKLVTSLQNFCHIDEIYPKPVDINACIDGIVILLKSRLKGEIEIVKKYGKIPPISCFMGQLHQVLMNIFSHTVDALLNEAVRQQFQQECSSDKNQPQIVITTAVVSQAPTQSNAPDSRWVCISIVDNSPGMSQEAQKQILDSFSTEKRADVETSLGVSYQIITARHGGKLDFRSQVGVGSEFKILLPLV
ncbi:MAG: CBS domain-containing protein [Nostoc sp. TH1S01]|nr:CBS domain-containing protein [Nostoc sp. TH1S01]